MTTSQVDAPPPDSLDRYLVALLPDELLALLTASSQAADDGIGTVLTPALHTARARVLDALLRAHHQHERRANV